MKKRSVIISGHATSVTLEAEFWDQLKVLAARDGLSINTLISQIDENRAQEGNLSSAVRVYILNDALNGDH